MNRDDLEVVLSDKEYIEKLEKEVYYQNKEVTRLNNIINKSKEIYLKELNKCNKNGTYVSKVAVDMFNVLEGNK